MDPCISYSTLRDLKWFLQIFLELDEFLGPVK
jgi:hypothetical protein